MLLLHRKIENWAAEKPDDAAISLNHQSFSWAALNEAVCCMRGALAARGVSRGDQVAILLPNCPHFVIAHFAVLGLGAVSVPINIQHKAREIGWQVESSEARVVIGWSKFRTEAEKAVSNLECVRHRIYLGDEIPENTESFNELLSSGEPLSSDPAVQEHDLAAVLYTSGVSGKPRGVELTHANFVSQTTALGKLLRIHSTDSMLGVLPFTGIMGLTTAVHLPLYHGAKLSVQSRFHAGDVLDCLTGEQITVFAGNPFMYAVMATFPISEKHRFDKLRHLICCEAKLARDTASQIVEKLRVPVCEGYGTTETAGIMAYNAFPGLSDADSVGQPLGGMEIAIFTDDNRPAPAGLSGRVAVRGPNIMRGYRHRPDRTSQVITEDGWMLTGDLGVMDSDSNLTVTGHVGDLIRKGGFPVHPREVEEILEGLPHINQVAVVGIPDPVYGEEIKACVVLKEGANLSPSEIIEYVKERIALYKCPKLIKFVKELPTTSSGRIIRSQLREEANKLND